jgi:hypothetical protein
MRFARHAAVGWGVGGWILGSFGAPAAKPTVSLLHASPVVISGAGYTAGARVLVTYRSGASVSRGRVSASIAGRFRVVLKGVAFKRCDGLQLGAGGASLRVRSCAAGGRPTVTARLGGLVSGSAFVPGERVKVAAQIGGLVKWESVKAGPRGAFTSHVLVPRAACTDADITAVGALGSRASHTVATPACGRPLVHGAVRIGPVTPVCRAGAPCDKPAADVTLIFTRLAAHVRVMTDARGNYRVRLSAGSWTVRASAGMRIGPVRFVVPRATSAQRNFVIDTGIR